MTMVRFFSIFSGSYYFIPQEHVKHMDCGQIPISQFPKSSCKICNGRGYNGKDTKRNHYNICKCLFKFIEQDRIVHKQVYDIPLDTKYKASIP